MFPYIIFDIDGTVVDSHQAMLHAYAHTCQTLGLAEDDWNRVFTYVGRRTTLIFNLYHGLQGEAYRRAAEIYYNYSLEKGLADLALYPGMGKLLEALREKGAVLTVATARTEAQLEAVLSAVDIRDYFTHIAACKDYGAEADKAALCKACIDYMGIEPRQAVMIGDRKFDIEGGKRAGAQTIGVGYGFALAGELMEAKPDYIVDSVEELHLLLLEGRA